jgi:hypothetical protein
MKKDKKMIELFKLLSDSWTDYWKNLIKFIMIYVYALLGILPFFIVMVIGAATAVSGWYVNLASGTKLSLIILFVLSLIASFALLIFYSTRAKIAWILLMNQNYPEPAKVFKASTKFFWPFFGVSLLTCIMVLAWGILLIIPGIVFAVYYSLAYYSVLCEGKRPFSAMERSFDLVRGYWWAYFGRLLFLGLITLAAYLILTLPLPYLTPNSTFYWFYITFYELIWMVLAPYLVVYTFKAYKNLVEING